MPVLRCSCITVSKVRVGMRDRVLVRFRIRVRTRVRVGPGLDCKGES